MNIKILLSIALIIRTLQAKARKEVMEVVGDKKSYTILDLNRLPYIEMVIKESLRLFPVAPYILRKVPEDFRLGKNIKV